MKTNRYRYLRAGELIRFGDERWDGVQFGWHRNSDRNMNRFSRGYRRIGKREAATKRWRRRLT